jgi:hypothetical protein
MEPLELELDDTADTRVLLVPATPPPMPLVLADNAFLARLEQIEADAAALKVVTGADAQTAAEILREITTAGRKLEAARLELKRPFLDINKAIDNAAADVTKRIETAKSKVKRHLTAFEEAERARLREIERQRHAELAKLEAQRRAEEEAARRRAEELAKTATSDDTLEIDFDEPPPAPKTETEKKIEAIAHAPTPVAQQPSGIRYKQRLIFRVVDAEKLPDQFIIRTPNERAIRELYVTGWKEGDPVPTVAGVEFIIDKTVESTGRRSEF